MINNIWKATGFALLIGLWVFIVFGLIMVINFIRNWHEFYFGFIIAAVMYFIYIMIQLVLSFLLKWILSKQYILEKKQRLESEIQVALMTLIALYVFVFVICLGIAGFEFDRNTWESISFFSIPYFVCCLGFVFRLHYLSWSKDL